MPCSLSRGYQRVQGICYPEAERCSFYHAAGMYVPRKRGHTRECLKFNRPVILLIFKGVLKRDIVVFIFPVCLPDCPHGTTRRPLDDGEILR